MCMQTFLWVDMCCTSSLRSTLLSSPRPGFNMPRISCRGLFPGSLQQWIIQTPSQVCDAFTPALSTTQFFVQSVLKNVPLVLPRCCPQGCGGSAGGAGTPRRDAGPGVMPDGCAWSFGPCHKRSHGFHRDHRRNKIPVNASGSNARGTSQTQVECGCVWALTLPGNSPKSPS